MVYMERLVAMDLLVDEAFVLMEVIMSAKGVGTMCNEVLSLDQSQLWAYYEMVLFIRKCLWESRDWRVAWAPRSCNKLAHCLAKWVSRLGVVGCSSFFDVPEPNEKCVLIPLVKE